MQLETIRAIIGMSASLAERHDALPARPTNSETQGETVRPRRCVERRDLQTSSMA